MTIKRAKQDLIDRAKRCATCDRKHHASTITAHGVIHRCMACWAAYYRAKQTS